MNNQLVKIKTAQLAKEKLFDISTFFYYINTYSNFKEDNIPKKWNNDKDNYVLRKNNDGQPHLTCCPTQSSLQTWLRDKHNINIFILPTYRKGKCGYDSFLRTGFTFEITIKDCNFLSWCDFNTHLEADWHNSNIGEDEINKETFEEYLECIDKKIYKTYEEALEEALYKSLKLI